MKDPPPKKFLFGITPVVITFETRNIYFISVPLGYSCPVFQQFLCVTFQAHDQLIREGMLPWQP